MTVKARRAGEGTMKYFTRACVKRMASLKLGTVVFTVIVGFCPAAMANLDLEQRYFETSRKDVVQAGKLVRLNMGVPGHGRQMVRGRMESAEDYAPHAFLDMETVVHAVLVVVTMSLFAGILVLTMRTSREQDLRLGKVNSRLKAIEGEVILSKNSVSEVRSDLAERLGKAIQEEFFAHARTLEKAQEQTLTEIRESVIQSTSHTLRDEIGKRLQSDLAVSIAAHVRRIVEPCIEDMRAQKSDLESSLSKALENEAKLNEEMQHFRESLKKADEERENLRTQLLTIEYRRKELEAELAKLSELAVILGDDEVSHLLDRLKQISVVSELQGPQLRNVLLSAAAIGAETEAGAGTDSLKSSLVRLDRVLFDGLGEQADRLTRTREVLEPWLNGRLGKQLSVEWPKPGSIYDPTTQTAVESGGNTVVVACTAVIRGRDAEVIIPARVSTKRG